MSSDELDAKIAELESSVHAALNAPGADWKEIWNRVREINADFKGTRYPSSQDYKAARHRVERVVADLKSQREEANRAKERNQKEWIRRNDRSAELKQKIVGLAELSWPHPDGFQEFLATISGAKILAEVVVLMIDVTVWALSLGLLKPSQVDDRKERLTQSSHNLRKAWAYFTQHKTEMSFEDKQAVFELLSGVQEEIDKEWTAYKEEKRENYERREQQFEERREKKRRLIREAGNLSKNPDGQSASARAKELSAEWKTIGFAGRDHDEALWTEFREALDSYFVEARANRAERLQAALERKRERATWLRESLAHDNRVLEESEEKLENVHDGRRADEIREHLNGKIESLREKIRGKEESLEEVEAAIEDIERTLSGLDR